MVRYEHPSTIAIFFLEKDRVASSIPFLLREAAVD